MIVLLEFQKPISCKNFKNKIELTKELNRILEKMIEKTLINGFGHTIDGNSQYYWFFNFFLTSAGEKYASCNTTVQ